MSVAAFECLFITFFTTPISDEESKKRLAEKISICKKIHLLEEKEFDELNDFLIN